MQHYQFEVDEASSKKRLDVFLSENLPEISRSRLKKLIDEKRVTVNERSRPAGYKVRVKEKIEFHIPPPKQLEVGHGYAMAAVLLRPKSRGSISLASADPKEPPITDHQFYTAGEDLDIILKGLKEIRRIVHAEVFKKYQPTEIQPGNHIQTDEDLKDYIRQFGGTIFHPVGTCKMGNDNDAVVDERLRVRGIRGLRVVDASIIPTIVGGNTNAPSIMIGEKASDMIKEDNE